MMASINPTAMHMKIWEDQHARQQEAEYLDADWKSVWVGYDNNSALFDSSVVFGEEYPGGWAEFWCEETGRELKQMYLSKVMRNNYGSPIGDRLNSLRN